MGVQVLARILPHTAPTLRSLNLCDNQLTASCLDDIALVLTTQPALRDLDLSRNEFTDGDTAPLWVGLAQNTTCQHLSLAHCALEPPHGTALGTMLRENRGLHSLNLDGNALRLEGVLAILSACAEQNHLVWLGVRKNLVQDDEAAVPDIGRGQGSHNTALRHLHLCKNMLSFSLHSSLTKVLERFRGLETLEVRTCLLGEWSVPGLCHLLKACPRLRELRAGRNILGFDGMTRLLPVASTHPALVILELQKNFNSFEGAPAARKGLVEFLQASPRIEILHMHGNLLFGDATRAEAIDLANALYRRSISGRFAWTGTRLFEFLRVRGVLDLYGLPRDAGALNNRDIFTVFRTDFERRVAFAMALHPRLGACSPVRCCDPLIVSLILASPLCPVRPASFVWDVSPSTSSDES